MSAISGSPTRPNNSPTGILAAIDAKPPSTTIAIDFPNETSSLATHLVAVLNRIVQLHHTKKFESNSYYVQ